MIDDVITQVAAEAEIESIFALTGIEDAILKEKEIKITESLLKASFNLPKKIKKLTDEFINEKTFKPIKLNLPDVDYISINDELFKVKDESWIESRMPKELSEEYQGPFSVKLIQIIEQLKTLAPRLPISIVANKKRLNDFERARFERNFRTINDPLTVLDDMLMGCLSRKQVQTLIQFYPKLYELMKTCFTVSAIEAGEGAVLPYEKLKMMSVFLLSSTVPIDLQQVLQANFNTSEASKPMDAGSLDVAEMSETKMNRIEGK